LTFNLYRTAHGIDEKFYNSKARTLDSDSEPLRIITVARFLDWKNIDLMIKSLNRFAQRGIKFEYSIVGEGPELESLKKLVEKLEMRENITFKAWVDQNEIINLFQQNHLFALMSYPETLGRIFFEAIANSLPILCTEKSGAYGLISSTHGATYAGLDAVEIESSLHDIYLNYSSIAQAAVIGSHSVKKYNWDSMSDFYFKLFQDSKN
jgi:glycosyltransferase involved in cell wall biosynthesis